MGITSLVDINADLLLVAITVAGMVLLGCIVIFNNSQSITNRTFLYFSILTALWGISNYIEYHLTTITATLWALRVHLFISVWHAFFFLKLAYVFPEAAVKRSKLYDYGFIPLVAITSLVALTPLTFVGITSLAPAGEVSRATPGIGILLFSLVAFGSLLSGLGILLRRTIRAKAVQQKQDVALLVGMTLTAFLILTFNVVLPNIFADVSFIPLAALFVFPFIALTFYAIYRHHLFDLKIVASALLGFLVTVFSFVNILYSQDITAIMVNVIAFFIILTGSIKIVRDTLDLNVINARQETLLYFVSHEVKVYLTKSMYAFASITEGDFGTVSPQLKEISSQALGEMREGMTTVLDILGAASLKRGTITYNKKPFDLKETVASIIRQQKSMADNKHLTLDFMAGEGDFTIVGDQEKIAQHVLRNIIDNAIKYTLSGDIHIDLVRNENVIRFSVRDSGIGITPEDMLHLFTEGGKGKESTKINVHSTGYGLFVAKTVCDAHGAKIWAESRGEGTGARFVVEFPLA